MININVDLSKWKIKIDGHANFDKEGKDIVWAAISTLFYTLCITLEEYKKGLRVFKTEDAKGNGCVIAKPKPEFEQNIAIVFMTICHGFELIAMEYSDYVKFTIKE